MILKKLKLFLVGIYIFIKVFFRSLSKGDELLTSSKTNASSGKSIIESQNEINSVYNDLIKKQVTEAVKELRHEMYFAERQSHKYSVSSDGSSNIKSVFSFQGKVENSDGNKIWIVQENIKDTGELYDAIKCFCDGNFKREFTLNIGRKFIPTFRIEEFANKTVIKKTNNDNEVILDIYVSQYPQQFMPRHRLFIAEMERIYKGDRRSSITDFETLDFMSFKAYGSDDFIIYKFKDFQLLDVLNYDGNYILRYNASIDGKPDDLLLQYFDPKTQEKSDKKELRKNGAFSFHS